MCNQEHVNEMKLCSENTMCLNVKHTNPEHNIVQTISWLIKLLIANQLIF